MELQETLAYSEVMHQCKSLQPAIDQFLTCSTRLHTTVVSTIAAMSSTLQALQNIAGITSYSRGHCMAVSDCLYSIHAAHRQLETDLTCVERSLSVQLMGPLQIRNEKFKKNVLSLEKKHARESKKMKESIKKKKEEISRLRKKVQKDSSSSLTNLLDQSTRQLYSQYKDLADKEQLVARMISQQERSHLCAVVACVKPFIEQEVKMFKKAELMSDIVTIIDNVMDDPNYKPNLFNKLENIDEDDSPPLSCRGSVMGSRTGSIVSVASITDPSSCSYRENISEKLNKSSKVKAPNLLGNSELEFSRACRSPSQTRAVESKASPKKSRENQSYTFSTVKRAHSPFRKLMPSEKGKRPNYIQPEPPRPSRPPLPPRSPYIEDESLLDLQHKLRDISGLGTSSPTQRQLHSSRSNQMSNLPPLPPRSAYIEDSSLLELQQKLSYLSRPPSLSPVLEHRSPNIPGPDNPGILVNTENEEDTTKEDHEGDNTNLVEIVELPDLPLPPPRLANSVTGFLNIYTDVEAGLDHLADPPQEIQSSPRPDLPLPPPRLANSVTGTPGFLNIYTDVEAGLDHLPDPPQEIQSSPNSHLPVLSLFPPHLPLSPLQHHHRRVQSLYSPGPSLADQILADSDRGGVNRSLSFGVGGLERQLRGGLVRTNIDEHIQILNQHKSSIMNLMKDDFP